MITVCHVSSRDKQFKIPQAVHSATSVMVTFQGEFDYFSDGEEKRVGPYEPVVYKKGHYYKRSVVTPIRYVLISFSASLEKYPVFLEYDEHDKERIKNTVDHLKEAVQNNLGIEVVEHLVNDLLLMSKINEQPQNNVLPEVINFIKEHFEESIPLDRLAEISGYSKQFLIRKFKRSYNKTPLEYITHLRLNKAKSLLIDTTQPISEIAEKCGFENQYYFSNVFKRKVGLSPLKYRQKFSM